MYLNSFLIFIVGTGSVGGLMKIGSKRRRTKEQIAQDRHEELQKIQLVEGKMERWQQMEAEL